MDYSSEDEVHVERILSTNNFYEILQIPETATTEQIKASHKKLALLVHPDKNNYPKSKEAFCALRKATAVLLDNEKRQEYNAYLKSPHGFAKEKFDLSEDVVDTILLTAGVVGIVGIAAGIWALFGWLTGKKENKSEPKYAR